MKILHLGNGIYFNSLSGKLTKEGMVVKALGLKEANLLALLCGKQNEIINHEEFYQKIWPNVIVSETSLTKIISLLRKSISPLGLPLEVKTYPKEGYGIVCDNGFAIREVEVDDSEENEEFGQEVLHGSFQMLGGNKSSSKNTQLNAFKKWLVIYSAAFASLLLLLEIFVLGLVL